MAGSLLKIDSRDLRHLDLRGRDIAGLGDTSPLMRDIAAAMAAWTDRRFETETAPDGTPWKRSRRALEEGGQTLTDSARLRQSIAQRADRASAEVGTNVIYAGVHQAGATIRPVSAGALVFKIGDRFVSTQEVTVPARPYLGIGGDDEVEIGAIVGDYLAGGFDEARP